MEVVEIEDVLSLESLAGLWADEANKEFNIDITVSLHLKHLEKMMLESDAVILGLKKESEIIGYMGICIFDNPVGKGKLASEHFWYVHPDHRRISAVRLLKAGIKWAKENGCSHFIGNASNLASDLHDRVCSLYERNGMSHFETTFICEV